ncbi:3-oxoacyl-[acyl-carrier-protein] reductase [Enterobacteriaceae endosymbiont of Plateumaris braccata]|uniref:3-oxoacyl-[acyl-carrier-protein] reductase n=1 Tax=Enterobacteriaceae endosymbiont of Plateumaris braccata TaxID=2675793 RepID=UPI0014494595|nr:3-oxoacyl-[acyl-carrier-protein] reductase [Enterobacteriaceae endosymbiont of Plateumaris braccata]QJC28050.1 3-oxoacyl-[acyl-carrier-protein] reductase [Enterobacteriaceae endosymbiont of Plateumaris braccata]
MNLTGKLALVTGASRGIGYYISNTLAHYGAKVIGTSKSINGVKIINKYLDKKGIGLILDLISNTVSVKNFLNDIRHKFGNIDILVNNAGIISDSLLINMKDSEWNNVLMTNLTSVFKLSQEVIRYMLKKSFGRIISIGSIIGSIGNIGQVNYAASKSGLIGFSKSLALEVAHKGVTVNIISPGFIETDMTCKLSKHTKNHILSKIPFKRFGTPQEIANVVAFLASDKASYITGETIHVNGGLYMS